MKVQNVVRAPFQPTNHRRSQSPRTKGVTKSPASTRVDKENADPLISNEALIPIDYEEKQKHDSKKARRQSLGRRVSFSQTVDVRHFYKSDGKWKSPEEEDKENLTASFLNKSDIVAAITPVTSAKAFSVFSEADYEDTTAEMKNPLVDLTSFSPAKPHMHTTASTKPVPIPLNISQDLINLEDEDMELTGTIDRKLIEAAAAFESAETTTATTTVTEVTESTSTTEHEQLQTESEDADMEAQYYGAATTTTTTTTGGHDTEVDLGDVSMNITASMPSLASILERYGGDPTDDNVTTEITNTPSLANLLANLNSGANSATKVETPVRPSASSTLVAQSEWLDHDQSMNITATITKTPTLSSLLSRIENNDGDNTTMNMTGEILRTPSLTAFISRLDQLGVNQQSTFPTQPQLSNDIADENNNTANITATLNTPSLSALLSQLGNGDNNNTYNAADDNTNMNITGELPTLSTLLNGRPSIDGLTGELDPTTPIKPRARDTEVAPVTPSSPAATAVDSQKLLKTPTLSSLLGFDWSLPQSTENTNEQQSQAQAQAQAQPQQPSPSSEEAPIIDIHNDEQSNTNLTGDWSSKVNATPSKQGSLTDITDFVPNTSELLIPLTPTTPISESEVRSNAEIPPSPFGLTGGQLSVNERITFSEFLMLADVRFLDDLSHRKPSVSVHLSSMDEPKTTADILDLACRLVPKVELYKYVCDELKETTNAINAEIQQRENSISENNPGIFQAIRSSNPEEVKSAKDQVKKLKNACKQEAKATWAEWKAKLLNDLNKRLNENLGLVHSDQQKLDNYMEEISVLRENISIDMEKVMLSKRERELAKEDTMTAPPAPVAEAVVVAPAVAPTTAPIIDMEEADSLHSSSQTGDEVYPRKNLKRSMDELSREISFKQDILTVISDMQVWKFKYLTASEFSLTFLDTFNLQVFYSPESDYKTITQKTFSLLPSAKKQADQVFMGLVEIANVDGVIDGFTDSKQLRGILQEISFRLNRVSDICRELKSMKSVVADVQPLVPSSLKKRHHRMMWVGEELSVADEVTAMADVDGAEGALTTALEMQFTSMEKEQKFFICWDFNPAKCDWYPFGTLRYSFYSLYGDITFEQVQQVINSVPAGRNRLSKICRALQKL